MSFDHQVTGVAVSEGGRVFVNFPRWFEDSPISVAELTKHGKLHPYPHTEWNSDLNDVRISPDGRSASMTDSGAQGALVVLDIASGKARRLLDGDGPTRVATRM